MHHDLRKQSHTVGHVHGRWFWRTVWWNLHWVAQGDVCLKKEKLCTFVGRGKTEHREGKFEVWRCEKDLKCTTVPLPWQYIVEVKSFTSLFHTFVLWYRALKDKMLTRLTRQRLKCVPLIELGLSGVPFVSPRACLPTLSSPLSCLFFSRPSNLPPLYVSNISLLNPPLIAWM